MEGLMYKVYGKVSTPTINPKDWKSASARCQSQGSHLATMLAAEDWEEVLQIKMPGGNQSLYKKNRNTWIGATIPGTDNDKDGVWGWSDGSPLKFTVWGSGNIRTKYGQVGPSASCALFGTRWGWWEWPCTSRVMPNWICQKKSFNHQK